MPDLSKLKKHASTVWIPSDKIKLLKKLSKKTKVPISEYIRRGIDAVLEKHGQRAEDRAITYTYFNKKSKPN